MYMCVYIFIVSFLCKSLFSCSLLLSLIIIFHDPLLSEMKLLFLWFWKNLSFFTVAKFLKIAIAPSSPTSMPPKKKSSGSSSFVPNPEMSVLDLPDLVLESILEKLSPAELCRTANVCASLRDKCSSDHLWEKLMEGKWGDVVGPAALGEWRSQMDSRKGSIFSERRNAAALADLWPLALIRSSFSSVFKKASIFPPVDSVMSCYLALESGRFWFPAQVYNRENGHVGFMLSCYDAELSYDRKSDTFIARYLGHGTRPSTMESGVTWDRLRAPPVETSPHDLHNSDCLNELGPGDQMEIQWRRNREFPYGWWYGVVGHLETCDGNPNYCRCRHSDTLVLEFNQYTRDSRWRRTLVNRSDHREKGNEVDGFYGGIRKLCKEREISTWRKLWPTEVFE